MSAREQIEAASSEAGQDGGNSSGHHFLLQQGGMPGLTQSPTTYARPRTRQRVHKPPPPLNVPDINDNAGERKRVLNVLAQRRYRERKRQSRAGPGPSSQGQTITPPTTQTRSPSQERTDAGSHDDDHDDDDHADQGLIADVVGAAAAEFPGLDFSDFAADPSAAWASPFAGPPDVCTLLMGSAAAPVLEPTDYGTTTLTTPPASSTTGEGTIDPSALLTSTISSGGDDDSGGNTTMTTTTDISFAADSYLLSVPELTLLRAFLRIATRLGMATTLFWDLTATSPYLDAGSGPSATTHLLPAGWRPTAAQRQVAHHPLLDLLPWPTVRDRLIGIFDLPEPARPAAARGPLGLAQLAYDLEDTAEGLRIYGEDPCEPASWEVGQVVFERWWFVFDRDVLAQSNRWRELRGAAKLRVGSVVGEL